MVRARTRRPARAWAAARGVVWSSSSSRSTPSLRSASAFVARDRVVLFVTKRSRCPAARSARTASAPPGIGWPETWKTPSMSSRMAAIAGDSIRVTRSVSIPASEIELRFSRSSGPGGQHAQKTESRAEAVFDVQASTGLSEVQKRRVISRAGPVLRAVAQDERSQWRNRELAIERLIEALREALRVERRRVATAPPPGAEKRRVDEKRRRGSTKRLRRRPVDEE